MILIDYLNVLRETENAIYVSIGGEFPSEPVWLPKKLAEIKGKKLLVSPWILEQKFGFKLVKTGYIFQNNGSQDAGELTSLGGLFEHQNAAVRKALSRNSLLYMDAGTGKTRVYIDWLCTLHSRGETDLVLFWTLKGLIKQVRAEIERFSAVEINLINDKSEFVAAALNVYLGNVEAMSTQNNEKVGKVIDLFSCSQKAAIVLDECHVIKSQDSLIAKNFLAFSKYAKRKIAGSGTAISRDILDLYNQIKFLDSDNMLESRDNFINRYIYVDDRSRVQGYRNIDGLAELISPFVYRCERDHVVTLPEIHFKKFSYAASDQKTAVELAVEIDKLLAKKNNPRTALYVLYNDFKRLMNLDLARLELAKKVIIERLNYGEKLIVVSRFIEPLDILLTELKVEFVRITGDSNTAFRNNAIEQFRGNIDLLVCSEVLNTGFNLEFCNNILFLNSDFNYKNREQMIGRIRRVGQQKEQLVIDIVSDLELSIDHKILANLGRKAKLINDLGRELGA